MMRICCAKQRGEALGKEIAFFFVIYKMEKRGNVGRNKKRKELD